MVFSFTFFTYNGQRLYRLNQKIIEKDKLGERLSWVIKHKVPLSISSIIFGLIGLVCTLFIDPYCFLILIPMGGLSVFYVIPLIPIYKNAPSLRDIPYLKIIVIGITWSIAIIWLPMMDSSYTIGMNVSLLMMSLIQVFLFVFAITLPFDVRDMKFDKLTQLKTIPRLIGPKNTIFFSETLLLLSLGTLFFLPIGIYFYPLIIGHIITMVIIACTNEKRNELFYAGWVEGTVIILYCCVVITDLLF
jgi:4-hydroxybenzoate polyprenyltransferase